MNAKTNLSDRLSLFAKMQTECQAAMAKGQEEAAAFRKSILGEGQPQEYIFRFALQSGDQNRIATALRELGEELYASAKRPEEHKVYQTDYWHGCSLELRWPPHYMGWAESTTVLCDSGKSNSTVSVRLLRPQDCSSEQAHERAEKIYRRLEELAGL